MDSWEPMTFPQLKIEKKKKKNPPNFRAPTKAYNLLLVHKKPTPLENVCSFLALSVIQNQNLMVLVNLKDVGPFH